VIILRLRVWNVQERIIVDEAELGQGRSASFTTQNKSVMARQDRAMTTYFVIL
jgi:hypothetical protein